MMDFIDYRSIYIFAPHGDDEIIGCYHHVLQYINIIREKLTVVYLSPPEFNNPDLPPPWKYIVLDLPTVFEFIGNIKHIDTHMFFAPDPDTEYHPLHKGMGHMIKYISYAFPESSIYTYTTRMNTEYVTEIDDPESKRMMLDRYYGNKSSLWKYDYRFFLFEGIRRLTLC